MKVICPKCQYENQADTTRVVCARCASIIEVRMDQGTGSGSHSNGRRQTAGLPFSNSQSNSKPSNSQGGQPIDNQPQDVYATRIGDEFDDVLDIPRPSQPNYQTTYESSPVFDDVFATPGYDSTVAYDYSADERKPTTPIDSFQTGMPRQRTTQDFIATPEPEFMGWPVLPENAIDEEEQSTGFTASRGGLLARILLGALVFGSLVFGAYYLLGDLISKRKDQAGNLVADPNAADQKAATGAPPPAAPSVEVKPAAANQQTDPTQGATTPPVINPKPADDKTGSKQIDIPPMGRVGRTDPPKAAAPAITTPNKGNLTIQVASYNDRAQANEKVARLKSANVEARVVQADIPGKGTWYRVQVGGFSSRDEALSYGNQLKSRGAVQDFIVTGKVN